MNKKILFIMNEYPALSSPTSIVVVPVIEALKSNNDIYVLSIGNDNKSNIVIDSIKCYSVNDGFCRKYRDSNGLRHRIARTVLRIKQFITIPIFPIISPVLQNKMNKLALRICEREEIDCIISVCFPPEAVAAGHYVKKRIPTIKFVPYIIDAFGSGNIPGYLPEKYARRRKMQYEVRVTSNADLVIAMEAAKDFYIQNGMIKNHYFLNPALLNIENCKSDDIRSEPRILEKGMINILYTGYLYCPDRNPSFVIQLISALDIDNICLTFVGKCDDETNKIIEKAKSSFNGVLKQIPFVPHDELKSILCEADYYLNMGVSNSNAISGKIFEYMAYGKPIITTYFDEKDAALPYLRKYPLSCCVNQIEKSFDDSISHIKAFIHQSYGKTVPKELVLNEFYTSTPEAFVDCLDSNLGES